jgi:hypothetical protein
MTQKCARFERKVTENARLFTGFDTLFHVRYISGIYSKDGQPQITQMNTDFNCREKTQRFLDADSFDNYSGQAKGNITAG